MSPQELSLILILDAIDHFSMPVARWAAKKPVPDGE
jgi:hypothetical protein